MNWKETYSNRIDDELLNTIDGNLRKAGENYWKLGRNRKFPSKFKAFYVSIMFKCENTGDQKKKIMGPYSKKIAESIMTDFLSDGKCSWVEEDWIR